MNWKNLNAAQKAEWMTLCRKNGIQGLTEMRRLYDELSASGEGEGKTRKFGEGGDSKTQQGTPYEIQPSPYLNGNPTFMKPSELEELAIRMTKPAPNMTGRNWPLHYWIEPITQEDIDNGNPNLYTEQKDTKYYKDKETGRYYMITDKDSLEELNNYSVSQALDEIPYSEFRKLLPKKDYIGGTPYEVRMKYLDRNPQIREMVQELASLYGVNPNNLMHRYLREGYVDKAIRIYNDLPIQEQRNFFEKYAENPINLYQRFGLDDIATHIMEGKAVLKNGEEWESLDEINEKGRDVQSAVANNLKSALGMMAADLAYRQDKLKKRGISPEDMPVYLNASFPLGLYHNDLANRDWVMKTYGNIPQYYSKFRMGRPLDINRFDWGGGKGKNESNMKNEEDAYYGGYIQPAYIQAFSNKPTPADNLRVHKDSNINLEQPIQDNIKLTYTEDRNIYTVKSGDNLSKIAKTNGLSLEKLLTYNPQYRENPDKIFVGQQIILSDDNNQQQSEPTPYNIRIKRNEEAKLNTDNLSAILGAKHQRSFAVIDKDAQVLTIYDKNGNILDNVHVNTGKSNEDYNTKTYTDEKGNLINMAGNNSTPAGITEITSIGEYHGVPSFQRARIGSDNQIKTIKDKEGRIIPDTIASSLHYEAGVGTGPNRSNGCVRISPDSAKVIQKYLGIGSRIYTLPQNKENSRFVLNDGKLSYTADNVYGKQKGEDGNITTVREKTVDKHDWDDYNTTIDKTYSPLSINVKDTDNKEYDENKRIFAKSLENNKEFIQQKLGLSSSEYNTLAMVAMGIANQETKFGTALSYKLKQDDKLGIIPKLKKLKGETTSPSQGVGQIKYGDDTNEAINIYNKIGVTDNHDDISNEAKAIIGRLYHIYRNQYQNAKSWYTKAGLSTEQALAYLYNGGSFGEIKKLVTDGMLLSDKKVKASSNIINRALGIKDTTISRQNYANNVVNKIDSSDFIGYADGGSLIEDYQRILNALQ